MITNSFRDSKEILKVSDVSGKYHKQFDNLIITFQSKVLPGLLENNLVKLIDDRSFGSSHGKYPIYKVVDQPQTLFYLSPIGAPTTVGILEEIVYAMGIKNIIMYGSAGALDKDITAKKIIVPTKAYRDEGTSYHYAPASEFIDINNHDFVSDILEEIDADYIKGYTWTTDAFYRETQAIYEERKSQGCICVEMEVSAVQAFANLRNINLFTFIYSADSLDHSGWNKRVLSNLPLNARLDYFLVARHIAHKLSIQ